MIIILYMINHSGKTNNFATLFDGNNLNDWQMAGQGKFVIVKEEAALQSEGGMGLLWYTKKIYRNFILKLDWKVHHKADNSGIFVRFPYPDNDPVVAVNNGYEIQIDDLAMPDGNPIHKTGAIYGFAAPASKQIASKEAGRWNVFEIHVTGQKYTVILNNKIVTEFVGNRSLQGYIGLQNHDSKSQVSFRTIRIKET
jgi:cytochrome c